MIGAHKGLSALLPAAMFLLLAGASTPPAAANNDSIATPADDEYVAAVQFRESYGFKSDEAYVRDSLIDSGLFPSTEWGPPLTSAEAARMAQYAAVQAAKLPAVDFARSLPGYAGVYTDYSRDGVVVFSFAEVGPPVDQIAARISVPAKVEVRTVTYSYETLEAIKADILADAQNDRSMGVVSVGIKPSLNAVIVGLADDAGWTSNALVARYGSGLAFRQDAPSEFDNCTTVKNCWPPKGGFDIRASTGNECTSGWIVKKSGTTSYRILTAGHCVYVGGSGTWRHGSASGPAIGTGQSNTWQGSGTHESDVGLIEIKSSAVPSTKNQFIRSTSSGVPNVASVSGWYPSWSQNEGDGVCRFGITSLKDCGQISAEDVAHISCLNPDDTNCKTIQSTWEVNFDSQGGDSGGPVYFNSGGAPYNAFGTHVHSTLGYHPSSPGWYTPFNIGRDEYQSKFGETYVLCVISSC